MSNMSFKHLVSQEDITNALLDGSLMFMINECNDFTHNSLKQCISMDTIITMVKSYQDAYIQLYNLCGGEPTIMELMTMKMWWDEGQKNGSIKIKSTD